MINILVPLFIEKIYWNMFFISIAFIHEWVRNNILCNSCWAFIRWLNNSLEYRTYREACLRLVHKIRTSARCQIFIWKTQRCVVLSSTLYKAPCVHTFFKPHIPCKANSRTRSAARPRPTLRPQRLLNFHPPSLPRSRALLLKGRLGAARGRIVAGSRLLKATLNFW